MIYLNVPLLRHLNCCKTYLTKIQIILVIFGHKAFSVEPFISIISKRDYWNQKIFHILGKKNNHFFSAVSILVFLIINKVEHFPPILLTSFTPTPMCTVSSCVLYTAFTANKSILYTYFSFVSRMTRFREKLSLHILYVWIF